MEQITRVPTVHEIGRYRFRLRGTYLLGWFIL